MEPEDIPLPETTDASGVPSAPVAVLAASSTAPAAEPKPFLIHLRHFFGLVINTFFPPPVRQVWTFLYTTVHNYVVTYPAIYRYGFLAAAVLVGLAEWQQSGSIPRPQHLTNAIIGFLCATLLVLGVLALAEFVETNRWPWEEEDWIWPWEKWLWGGTVGDFGASVRTLESPVPPTTPFIPRTSPSRSTAASIAQSNTPIINTNTFDISMPPPTVFKRPIIIPPTPQLPGGMRPPPTPAQIHKSGIIGESPMPQKFRHFSSNGFVERYNKLQAVSDWHDGVGAVLVKCANADRHGMVKGVSEQDISDNGKEVCGSGRGEEADKGKGKAVEAGVDVDVDLLEVPELIPDN